VHTDRVTNPCTRCMGDVTHWIVQCCVNKRAIDHAAVLAESASGQPVLLFLCVVVHLHISYPLG